MKKILEVEMNGDDEIIYHINEREEKELVKRLLSDVGLGMFVKYSCEEEYRNNKNGRVILLRMTPEEFKEYSGWLEDKNDGK